LKDDQVSAETRNRHPEVPWKDVAGMRDRVVHDYFGISLDIVWDVVKSHAPPLLGKLRPLVAKDLR